MTSGSRAVRSQRYSKWRVGCYLNLIREPTLLQGYAPVTVTDWLVVGRDDAVETTIAEQFKTDKVTFEKNAKQWVKQYAK